MTLRSRISGWPGRKPHRSEAADLAEGDLVERLEQAVRMEIEARQELASIESRASELERAEADLREREQAIAEAEARLSEAVALQEADLERLAGLSRLEASELVLEQVRVDSRRQAGIIVRQAQDEARLEADRRARDIVSVATQRLAASQTSDGNTTVIQLPNEEMKGRIIGKEGRNIRALQAVTGVDVIIDETPESVVVSSFDPVRREVARLTLEALIEDGRIHPAACEAAHRKAELEVDAVMLRAAEDALLETRVSGVDPELVKMLGRLHFRTSYGQNVLAHVVECSHLASMMASELGASTDIARRAALLHDIGKAVTHEFEGTHAAVGAMLAGRHGEIDPVVHAIEAHHGEVEPRTVEAVLVQAADALSGGRPGARGNSLDQYVKRLSDLEEMALRHSGVRKVFAMQAGRELRVIVDPGEVDDQAAALMSHEIASSIEREMEYPGQVRVTVIRELRTTRIAH